MDREVWFSVASNYEKEWRPSRRSSLLAAFSTRGGVVAGSVWASLSVASTVALDSADRRYLQPYGLSRILGTISTGFFACNLADLNGWPARKQNQAVEHKKVLAATNDATKQRLQNVSIKSSASNILSSGC